MPRAKRIFASPGEHSLNVARGETVRIAVRQDLPGRRMYHCHILEHEDQGMMGISNVVA